MAEEALGHAAVIASSLDAEIVVLRVVEASPILPDPVVSGIDWRLRRAEAVAYLEGVVESLRSEGVKASPVVVEGRAASEIVSFARARGVDLVILSAYGQGEASEFALGGTVHKVLSTVRVSVMVVRPADHAEGAHLGLKYRRIVVPVNGSPVGEWALCQAASIARRQEAELVMLQVLREPPQGDQRLPRSTEEAELLERLRELRRRRAEQYLGHMASQLGRSGIRVRHRVVSARRVAEGIREAALEEGADLLVISAHGTGGAAFPYGGVPERLLVRCPIPLLVLQDLAEEDCAQGSWRRAASHP